jgi:hypothetical protein
MLCKCSVPVAFDKVSRTGSDFGRPFLKCGSKPPRCDFFSWVDANVPPSMQRYVNNEKSKQIDNTLIPQRKAPIVVKLSLSSYNAQLNAFWFSAQRYAFSMLI